MRKYSSVHTVIALIVALLISTIFYLFNQTGIADALFSIYLPGIFVSINLFGGPEKAGVISIYIGFFIQTLFCYMLVLKAYRTVLNVKHNKVNAHGKI